MSEAAVETTVTETPAAPSIPTEPAQQAPEQNPQNDGSQVEIPQTAQQKAVQAYVANLKYKVPHPEAKGDLEKEFDDWAKPFITKKEIEEKFRDLYSKAGGLEYTKKSRDTFKTEAETAKGELGGLQKSLNVLSQYVQNDDIHSFVTALRIPEEKILKYALERVNYHNLPPEKRAEYDKALDTRSRATLLAEENQRLQQEGMRTQALLRDQELGQAIGSPEVRSIAEAYDSRMGVPGAFKNECIRRGAYYFQVHRKDVPANVISQEVAQEISKLIGSPAPVSTQVAPQGVPPQQELQTQPERKPVIPNISGKGTSPAKKVPRSLADLKKLRQEL